MRTSLKAWILGAASMPVLAAGAPAVAQPSGVQIEEVIVTARRVSESINRAPLSISAVTAETLEKQTIRDFRDLSRAVPALTFQSINLDGSTTIAIRGIRSVTGSATTGIYLDDVPVHKRFISGGNTGNGSPIPDLFDLERVEVLRGPQGTLYGGSTQGGAVRFITPAPDLEKMSAFGRAEISRTRHSDDTSYDIGAAVGGPLVRDRLGFRVSAKSRRTGGYIDRADPRTGAILEKDVNVVKAYAVRGALRWAPADTLDITLSGYRSQLKRNDQDLFNPDAPLFVAPAASFNAFGQPAASAAQVAYTRPPITYPARTFSGPLGGPYNNLVVAGLRAFPRDDDLKIASLTVDYQAPWFDIKSITARLYDNNVGLLPGEQGTAGAVILGHYAGYIPPDPNSAFNSSYYYGNKRTQWSQELRLSSKPGSRLSWVVGGFFLEADNSSFADGIENVEAVVPFARGVSSTVFFGVNPAALRFLSTSSYRRTEERSMAVFADATYELSDEFKINAGIRYSRERLRFQSVQTGYLNGPAALNPSEANGLVVDDTVKSSPVTPKVGLTYQITPRNMVYMTAARGFRAGGVNGSIPNTTICNQALAVLGGSKPTTFDPDTVWSYEVGAKVAPFGGRAQINASVFQIDWKDVQLTQTLPDCRYSYSVNAGSARSRGFDLQAQARLVEGLTVYANIGYNDSEYTRTTLGPPSPLTGARALIVVNGDPFPVPSWTVSGGFEYSRRIAGYNAYLRADYTWTGSYQRGVQFGRAGVYNPDTIQADATTIVNARAGVEVGSLELAVFARNLFNSTDLLSENYGRTGCTTASCEVFSSVVALPGLSTFQPRTIGISAAYRY